MTCAPAPTFRLLDERVGWDLRPGDGLTGVVIEGGALTLAALHTQLRPDRVAPAQIAWMCETCAWWLGTASGIARLGPCDDVFVQWLETAAPVIAVAARGTVLAAVVEGEGVRTYDVPSALQIGEFLIANATAVSLSPWRTMLVGDAAGLLHELEPSGLPCGSVATGAPIAHLAHPPAGECRTVVVHDDGTFDVVAGDEVTRGDRGLIDELAPTGITVVTELGFCLEGRGCFDWHGEQLDPSALGPGESRYATRGQYLSEPLDSGVPACRWHRVRLDADVPAGTTLEVAFATTDGPVDHRPEQQPEPGTWTAFPAGDPDPKDWFEVAPGVTDATISTPPGRHGYVRIRLSGDGLSTPVVHQLRLDLPRRTSLDELPAVYSEGLDARDFSERFVSLFDAQLEELDEVIARRSALLDSDSLPDDALGWLAGLLGVAFEAEMTPAQRRALIMAAPGLFRRRGTPGGLIDTLSIALGISATVEELGPSRPWGAVGHARVGAVRLFGRSRARVRLGASALGSSPLISRGNPDDDARLWGSGRIVVTVPPESPRALVERVVRSQTPANIVATVRMRAPGFVLTDPRVGIDTVLVGPEPAVVGQLRLGRGGVLRRGRAVPTLAIVGKPLIALPTTRME
jgi:phage tail-like protein